MDYASLLATIYLLIGVLTVLLGLVILRENPGMRLNRVTSLMLFFAGIGALLGAGSLFVVRAGGAAALPTPLIANFAYLWEFFFPTLLLFAASFPQELPLLKRHSWGDLLIYLPHTIHFFLMFSASIWGTSFGLLGLSERVPILGGLFDLVRVLLREFFTWHRHLFSLMNLTYVGLSVFLIARNHAAVRNASVRNQLRTILVGIGVGVVLYSIGVPLNVLLGLNLSAAVSSTLLVAALGVCAGTIAYAIVRHRFLEARWIVRKTILYAVASAIIILIYFEVVRLVGRALAESFRIPPGVLDWVALVVPLVLFQPIMGRLEDLMEGSILRGRRELRVVVARFSQEMSASLDFDALALGLVRELPEALAANGAAILLRPDRPSPAVGFRTVAASGFERESLDLVESLSRWLPDALVAGRPHTRREWIEAAIRSGRDPRESERVTRERAPALTYELRHAGERLGLLLLGDRISGMRYGGEEISILTSLATQAGVALKNSLLYRENLAAAVLEEELVVARRIQQAFLPSRFPKDLPVDVHGLNLPSKQVGGDYFDFFPVVGGGYVLAIADVAGKGVPAALLASVVQASLRTLLRDGTPVGRVLERVNAMLCESTSPEQFVTLFLGRLDPSGLKLTYCNAGHNYPILATSAGSHRLLDLSELVLGIDEGTAYPERQAELAPGDALLLYTDGVTEARRPDGEEFGEERLSSLLCGRGCEEAEAIVGRIRDEVLRFTRTGEVQDDMTLLCLRVP